MNRVGARQGRNTITNGVEGMCTAFIYASLDFYVVKLSPIFLVNIITTESHELIMTREVTAEITQSSGIFRKLGPMPPSGRRT